ncbi:hypothetical protein C8Q80DRAFT_903581 [Daedaleopsis nitida]|nr:hypothetical protein C8Q80DRAFT_903581 [Daedaleopsis nitida]
MILCSPCCSPQFVHAAQLLIHSLQAEVQELYDDAAATAHICGECKKSMKKSKRTPVNKEPPPGTEEQQEQLKLAGREYALLVRPWASRPAMAITQRPTIDPEDPITRFASPMSQRLAIAAEIHTFLPKHMLDLLCEPWGVPMFSYAVGQRKGHMLEKIKPNRAAIFSHIPDIDINLEYWRGTSQQFPPSFFPPGQHGVMPKVFCQPSFVKILLICNYGAGALVENHVPRTNCSAILWAVDEVTPGMLAFAACVLRFLLSGESIFKQSWEKHFDFYLRFLLWMRLNQSDVYKRLIAWLDESVYPQSTTTEAEDFDKNAPLAPKPGEISSTPFDAMDEAWNKLDWSIPGVQEKLPDVQNRPVEMSPRVRTSRQMSRRIASWPRTSHETSCGPSPWAQTMRMPSSRPLTSCRSRRSRETSRRTSPWARTLRMPSSRPRTSCRLRRLRGRSRRMLRTSHRSRTSRETLRRSQGLAQLAALPPTKLPARLRLLQRLLFLPLLGRRLGLEARRRR